MQELSLYIPCFNVARYIALCLEAVCSQTRPADEIIVVDDGSADETVSIASRYPVKIVRHGSNKGLAAARNTGVRSAAHDLVASLDADCVPKPDWLEKLSDCLTDDTVAGAGGKLVETNRVSLPDRWRTFNMRQHWGDTFIRNPAFLFGNNTLFRKPVLQEAGFYNERLRTNFEDVAISETITRGGHTLVYQPAAVVEHLRTDTLTSVLRTNWKWRFLGYRHDITLRNVMKGILKDRTEELRYFLGQDVARRDLASAALSLLAVGYAVAADLKYLVRHNGESKVHLS
jgi:glycosyltransferase involved in cell wall biosynthesis